MDSDDLVIIDSEPSMKISTRPLAQSRDQGVKHDADSDDDFESETHPIIHTNTMMRSGKYRYHNYLRDTNDNCAFCHDFLLQAYRERRFGACPPPPPMMAPVGYCESPGRVSTY